MEDALSGIERIDFSRLNTLAAVHPVVAKRHYHRTGALRWFDVAIVPLVEVPEAVSDRAHNQDAMGAFLLALPADGESTQQIGEACRNAVESAADCDVIVGVPRDHRDILTLARELLALEQVNRETPELQGDPVARREVDARIATLLGRLEGELERAFDGAVWHRKGHDPEPLAHAALNTLASDLADARFRDGPILHNELLNRTKPSSNAVAARNALLRRMVVHQAQERLGIEGFPAEGGLFGSLLEATGLHRRTPAGWRFATPTPGDENPCHLAPAWKAATAFLQTNSHRPVPVAELYDIWRRQPLGIKDGLMPVLAVAFMLSRHSDLAVYRQGIFQSSLSDLDMDYLTRDPADIQLRWMELSDASRRLLSDMADVVRELDPQNALPNLEPIDVARGLVAIYDHLPPWVTHTQRLSVDAKRVRALFKQANDPNKLIFDDIPRLLGGVAGCGAGANGAAGDEEEPRGSRRSNDKAGRKDERVTMELPLWSAAETGPAGQASEPGRARSVANQMREGLLELKHAYPAMLHRLRETLLEELQVPNASPPLLAELRERAENIRQLGGDHRLEAFVLRCARFRGADEDMESLASMAANKPAPNWVDVDVDRAAVELAALSRQFVRAEAFAHVKGRPDKRHAVAVVVGMEGRGTPLHDDFDIAERDRKHVDALIRQVDKTLDRSGEKRRNIILAALAGLSARYLRKPAGAARKGEEPKECSAP